MHPKMEAQRSQRWSHSQALPATSDAALAVLHLRSSHPTNKHPDKRRERGGGGDGGELNRDRWRRSAAFCSRSTSSHAAACKRATASSAAPACALEIGEH